MEDNLESSEQADTSTLTNSPEVQPEAAKHPPKKVRKPKPKKVAQLELAKEAKPTPEKESEPAKAAKKLIVKQTRVGVYEIGYDGGGGTPKELGGEWTKMRMALSAIANYESRKATMTSGN